MAKFNQLYKSMIDDNQALFDDFRIVHDLYIQDRKKHAKEFNEKGKPVVDLLRDYEQRLCQGMERGQFGKFSHQVADKFWTRVKKDFSHIEMVGVEILSQ